MHIHPISPDSDLSIASSLHPEESAAIKIQAGFRGYRVRKQLNRNHHHHQRQQQQTRKFSNGYLRKERRIVTATMTTPSESSIAAANGNLNGGTPVTARTDVGAEDSSIEDRCATKIQAGVRGFLVRKKQKIAADAATKIQASFRGFKVRKEAQKLKQK